MNWRLFLDTLQAEGGQLQLDGEDLVYNGQPKALTSERLQILKAQKAAIIDFIRRFHLHPLAYGQKSLWFEYQMTPDGAGYNISVALRIHSAVDWAALQKAFQGLVNRHPALRTTFTVADGTPMQAVHRYCPVALTPVDASQWSEAALNRLRPPIKRRLIWNRGRSSGSTLGRSKRGPCPPDHPASPRL